LLSKFAFNFSFRRYIQVDTTMSELPSNAAQAPDPGSTPAAAAAAAAASAAAAAAAPAGPSATFATVGRGRLTLSNQR